MTRTLFTTILILLTSSLFAQKIIDEKIESKIDSIIKELTLDEKVAMCHAQSKFSSPGVPRLGIPELWMSDGPHGVRAEINWDNWGYSGRTDDSVTAFPALTCLASTFNPDLAYKYGFAIGEEARYRKKDVLLGPGVNIYRTPLCGRNFEYMGEDPLLASILAVEYVKGVQKNGVAACVKHYALNNQEEYRGHINVKLSDRALHEIYLPAYKATVLEGNAWSIMGAYNQVRGQYCSHNEFLINKILKGDWGFDGVVITDWGATHDTRQAALNGLDIEMGTWTNGLTFTKKFAYDNYYLANPFKEMIKKGEIPESVVDEKVKRILRLMFRTNMNKNRPFGKLNSKEHQIVARNVATEGIVLLKNEEDFFPIDKTKNLKIAVIGENATRSMTAGGGSSELKPKYEISPLEGIKAKFKNAEITYSLGYASGKPAWGRELGSKLDADSLVQAAVNIAKDADIVLYIGGLNKNHFQDCEGADRLIYGLPFGQEKLISKISKVNDKLGVILISGNAVSMPWINESKSILQAWYLGSEAGFAIADIISGDVNPSGKLPFTFPVKLEDNGAHSFGEISYPGDSIDQEYKEGILVGYRWHDTKKIKPLYSFGYGLSYSDFKISDIEIEKKEYLKDDIINISCSVENTGSMDGSEVIQVYIGKPKSKVERAQKELKGFSKQHVKKGQKTTINIPVSVKDLAYYDEKSSDWIVEKGNYEIYVGNSSDNIVKKLKIEVK